MTTENDTTAEPEKARIRIRIADTGHPPPTPVRAEPEPRTNVPGRLVNLALDTPSAPTPSAPGDHLP